MFAKQRIEDALSRTYAILADIHGNLEAFEAVLRDVDEQQPDKIAVLGDTIGYGPNPTECLEKAYAVADVFLIGNHEKEIVLPSDRMENTAQEILDWTAEQIADSPVWAELRDGIDRGEWPKMGRVTQDNLELVHASPKQPVTQYLWPGHESQYVVFNEQIDQRLKAFLWEFKAEHGFNAHTHVPAVLTAYDNQSIFDPFGTGLRRNGECTFVGPNTVFFVPDGEGSVSMLTDRKVVINPGSVGQPRILGNPQASYAIYDGDQVHFKRIAYDIDQTVGKITEMAVDAEVKEHLIERLRTGV